METTQLVTARVIVDQYQHVLISVLQLLPFGAPDDLLPHSRDEIRQSIREVARQIAFGGIDTGVRYDELRMAYQSLASFVPYEEANIAARLQHALERNQFAFLATAEAETARRLSRQIEREAARLTREFDAWITESADPLLTEADLVLADFERKAATARQ